MTVPALAKLAFNLVRDEHGPTATEYAVMLALVLVVILASVTLFGESLGVEFVTIRTALFG